MIGQCKADLARCVQDSRLAERRAPRAPFSVFLFLFVSLSWKGFICVGTRVQNKEQKMKINLTPVCCVDKLHRDWLRCMVKGEVQIQRFSARACQHIALLVVLPVARLCAGVFALQSDSTTCTPVWFLSRGFSQTLWQGVRWGDIRARPGRQRRRRREGSVS